MTEQHWRRELHNFVQQLMLICESPDEREKVLKSWCERPAETVGERGVQVREVVRDALREEKEKVRNRLIYLLNSLFAWAINEKEVSCRASRILEEIDRFDQEVEKIWKDRKIAEPVFDSCFHYELRRQLTSEIEDEEGDGELTIINRILEDVGFFQRYPVEVGFWAQHFLAVERYHREEAIEQETRLDELVRLKERISVGGRVENLGEFLLYLEDRLINSQDEDLEELSREITATLSGKIRPELFPHVNLEHAVYFTLVAHQYCLAENISEEDIERIEQLKTTREMSTLKDLMLLIYDQAVAERRLPLPSKILDRLQDLGFPIDHKDFRDVYKTELVPLEKTLEFEKKKLPIFLNVEFLSGEISSDLEGQKVLLEEVLVKEARKAKEMLQAIFEAKTQPLPKSELIKNASRFSINWLLGLVEDIENLPGCEQLKKDVQDFLPGPLMKLIRPRKGYEFTNKGAYRQFLERGIAVHLESMDRCIKNKKVESLFDFKYFCRWLIFREFIKLIAGKDKDLKLDSVENAQGFLPRIGIDWVYDGAARLGFDLDEAYPCSPVRFYKFLMSYFDLNVIAERVTGCCGEGKAFTRDDIEKEILKIIPEWAATIYRVLVASTRKKLDMPRLPANPDEIQNVVKIFSPAFCHLEEIALKQGKEFLERRGDCLFLPEFKPIIETEDELRAFIRLKIREFVGSQDIESFAVDHDLRELKKYIEEKLQEADIVPEPSFPESVFSIVLEEIQPLDRALEEELAEYANQLLRLLPKSNCGGCGETSCLNFAYSLLQNKKKPTECQQMTPEEMVTLKRELDTVMAVVGEKTEGKKDISSGVSRPYEIAEEFVKPLIDVQTILARQLFWERLKNIFKNKQPKLQIYKQPNAGELYRMMEVFLGFEATERLRKGEKEFLIENGEKYIEAGWLEFFDTYDWYHRIQMRRQSAPYLEEHDALHQSASFYKDKLYLNQLSDFDRELVLKYRLFKYMDGFSDWWNEDLLQMSDPDYQIQDWEDFSKIIKNAYWHQESSPSAGEIYEAIKDDLDGDIELSDAARDSFDIFVKDIISRRQTEFKEEAELVERLKNGEKIDDLEKLQKTINYLVKDIALKGEYLPELSLTNRINAVFSAFDSSRINIDPELLWRWETLPGEVQEYIGQLRTVDRDELTNFQKSKEGIQWKDMVSLRDAILKGYIFSSVKNLEEEETELGLFNKHLNTSHTGEKFGYRITPGTLSLYVDRLCRTGRSDEEIAQEVEKLWENYPEWEDQMVEDAITHLIRQRQLVITIGEDIETPYPRILVKMVDDKIRSRHAMDKERLLHYLFILAKMEGNLDTLTALLREIRETSDIIEAAWLNFTTERSLESPKPVKGIQKQGLIHLEATSLKNKELFNKYLEEGLPRGEKPAITRAYWELINVIRFFVLKLYMDVQKKASDGLPGKELSPEEVLQLIRDEYDIEGLSEDSLLKAISDQIRRLSSFVEEKIWIYTTVTARKFASQNQELLEVERQFFKKKNELLKAGEGEELLPLAELAAKRGVELGKVKEAAYYHLSDLLEDERIKSFQRRIRQIVNQLEEKRAEIYHGWKNGEINRRTVFYLLRSYQKERKVAQWDDFRCFIRDQRTLRIKKLEESEAPDVDEMREVLERRFKALLGVDLREIEDEALNEAKGRLSTMREEVMRELETTFADDYFNVYLAERQVASVKGSRESKTSSFVSVSVEKGSEPELIAEIPLDKSLDEIIDKLPQKVSKKINSVIVGLKRQCDLLRKSKELTGIEKVRIWENYVHAAHLDPADTANFSFLAIKYIPEGDAFFADHLEAHALMNEPQDSRIPHSLEPLVEEICAIRHSLEEIRNTYQDALRVDEELLSLFDESKGILDSKGKAKDLIRAFMSRNDWRERDIFEMLLEFLNEMPQIYGGLKEELELLEAIRHEDHLEYEKIITGMISEARANLEKVAAARRYLQKVCKGKKVLDSSGYEKMVNAMALALGIPEDVRNKIIPGILDKDPVSGWQSLYDEGSRLASERGRKIELKNFERASLFLLPELKPGDLGHARFCRSLIESTESYNKILAGIYASEENQIKLLTQQVDKFNRLPENAELPVNYTRKEMKWWLRIFYLRPDVVEAIYNREKRKDIYMVISGLQPRAYLPRVLHEVQSIFGYITPEAFSNIVSVLGLNPTDVIKVIASYKEFSVDPSGDIIIYICKGTACFLRGQPHISRTLSTVIGADRGQVADCGIQYIEMDCFGVCHMAPVVKAGNTFIPSVDPDSIPHLVEQLLKGVSYENRVSFLNRIRRVLTRGHKRILKRKLVITGAINLGDVKQLKGCGVAIDARGVLTLAESGDGRELGRLVEKSVSFEYTTASGVRAIGSLILDESNQVTAVLNYPDVALEKAVRRTMKPLAVLRDRGVAVRIENEIYELGEINSNTVVVEKANGEYGSITFDGPNARAILEEEKGIPTRRHEEEDPEFIGKQDRVLLGFAAGVDPDNIDSYIEHGGYRALKTILGLNGGKRWSSEDIIAQIKESNLRGRGGAGFPTGRKWEGLYRAVVTIDPKDENKDSIKLIVANGDEGDPGAFMDRTLIQEKPHLLIEGMIIAALAINARYGVIYVRKEYEDAVRRIENALFQARRRGFLGRNICGIKGLDFDLEIRLGAGAFVAGEKRAIMRAIEGKPAEPTLKAVSNSRRGLWGKPTLLNNVETFANVPLIIQRGGRWFKRQGYKDSGGTKIFSVAGIVKKTGLVEVRFGRTLRDIINICGGIREEKRLAGVQIGGPSGAILSLTGIREYLLHIPLDFDIFNQVGAMLGSGGLVFIGEDDDVVRLARHFTDWLEEESCGQCPSCLGGTASLGRTLDTILNGEGLSLHVHVLWAKGDAVKAGSQCGLGKTAANPVTSALRFFPQSFLHYLLMNLKLNRLELFRCLEALRLLTRENVEIISKRKRVVVGHVFTLRKGMVATFYQLLKNIDQYKAPQDQQAWKFLQLLGIEEHEVGKWDITGNFSLEELARHEEAMKDTGYDVLRPAV